MSIFIKRDRVELVVFITAILSLLAPVGAQPGSHDGLPPERVAPYSMVCYGLADDESYMRWYIGSLRDLGCTQALALVYWWQWEPLNDEWWQEKYGEDVLGESYIRKIDLFVDLCHEMGIRPAFRLGVFNRETGLWHPADPSGSIEPYTDWVGRLAERYRGRIDHYVVGDELNRGFKSGWKGTAEEYFTEILVPVASALREADPDAEISSSSTSSSPAKAWNLELIKLGLADQADGIGCNLWNGHLEDPSDVKALMEEARALWPDIKFFSNGTGYAERDGLHDAGQVARVAQSMFTLWDLGWDSAPYYLYGFSVTADTKQDFGLVGFPRKDQPAQYTDAWYAYQTIAHTFYNRDQLEEPDFEIELKASRQVKAADGTVFSLVPPDVTMRAFRRGQDELLLYLAYRDIRAKHRGHWDVVIHDTGWSQASRVPLLDYQNPEKLEANRSDTTLTVPEVEVSAQPTILVFRR